MFPKNISHPVINLCLNYHSPGFISFFTILAPVISSLDEIYSTLYCNASSLASGLNMQTGHGEVNMLLKMDGKTPKPTTRSITYESNGTNMIAMIFRCSVLTSLPMIFLNESYSSSGLEASFCGMMTLLRFQ